MEKAIQTFCGNKYSQKSGCVYLFMHVNAALPNIADTDQTKAIISETRPTEN